MKYEPTSQPDNTDIGFLMMPYAYDHDDTNWELVELVQATLSTLSKSDQDALEGGVLSA